MASGMVAAVARTFFYIDNHLLRIQAHVFGVGIDDSVIGLMLIPDRGKDYQEMRSKRFSLTGVKPVGLP